MSSAFRPKLFSSHPVRVLNLAGGRFQFRDAKLVIESEEEFEEFEKVLALLRKDNSALAQRIVEISAAKAEEIAANYLAKAVTGTQVSGSLEMAKKVADSLQPTEPPAGAEPQAADDSAKPAPVVLNV